MIRRGREVYVLIEGIVELDEDVEPERDGYVTVRTHRGFRVALPIDCVAEWDVDIPLSRAPQPDDGDQHVDPTGGSSAALSR